MEKSINYDNVEKQLKWLGGKFNDMRDAFVIPVVNKTHTMACYNVVSRSANREISELPFRRSLPILLTQFGTIMFLCYFLILALKRLRQPRIVGYVLGGFLAGPTFAGKIRTVLKMPSHFTPFDSLVNLETIGNIGIVYYMFLVGLELDIKPLMRLGRKALGIALSGIFVAIGTGCALHFLKSYKFDGDYSNTLLKRGIYQDSQVHGPFFWAVALSTTSFPDVARILADVKLLHSELGRLALSASVISDLFSWFLFLLLLAVSNQTKSGEVYEVYKADLSTLAFLGLCVFVLRPALPMLIRFATKNNDDKKEEYNDLHVTYVLAVVILSGVITDSFGTLSYVGPFMLGAVMPRGGLRKLVMEKIEPFIYDAMMPLFFLIIGLRTNGLYIFSPTDNSSAAIVPQFIYNFIEVLVFAFLAKIVGTFIAALFNKMTPRDALALGVVMNTKGVLALLVLSAGRDVKALNTQTFSVMIVAAWAITLPVGPFLAYLYKTAKRSSAQYKHRNIRSIGPDTELRVMACTHDSRNASGVINLLEATNPTAESPICIFATQLVELTGHTSAMLIVKDACKTKNEGNVAQAGPIKTTTSQDVSNYSDPFECYAKQRENVLVQTFTIISAYATMHEDILNLMEDKCITLAILPFHKEYTVNGTMEEPNPAIRKINKSVIDDAQCSVAVFVDRGLGISQISTSTGVASPVSTASGLANNHRVASIFIGGEDDREALAYAKRMASHPGVELTVIRFILNTNGTLDVADEGNEILEAMADTGRQKQLDNMYLDGFRVHTMQDPSIEFLEEVVNSWEDTVNVMESIEGEFDLYIMGRRHRSNKSADVASVLDSSDAEELGILADALASCSFFTVNTSLLIVQQGTSVEDLEEALEE